MIYNIIMKNEMKNGNLYIHLNFKDSIENKEEFRIVSACATVAYFLQKRNLDLLVDDTDIYAKDRIVCQLSINEKTIDGVFYLDELKKVNPKLNPIAMVPGLRAYYNIYFNLYQNKEYYKIEEYYQTIKKA